jgi:hypothetical protein
MCTDAYREALMRDLPGPPSAAPAPAPATATVPTPEPEQRQPQGAETRRSRETNGAATESAAA